MKKLLLLVSMLLPLLASAAVPEWEIQPAESSLKFTATQNNAPVTGEFKSFSGTILVDPNNYKSSSIHIMVDINSLSVSYAELKSTLLTADWFNPKAFPKAEFLATDFIKIGENKYQANGSLTIRKISAPVTLTFTTSQPSPNKGIVIGSTIIKRNTFGVGQGEWAGTDDVKDEVRVNFKVTAVKKP